MGARVSELPVMGELRQEVLGLRSEVLRRWVCRCRDRPRPPHAGTDTFGAAAPVDGFTHPVHTAVCACECTARPNALRLPAVLCGAMLCTPHTRATSPPCPVLQGQQGGPVTAGQRGGPGRRGARAGVLSHLKHLGDLGYLGGRSSSAATARPRPGPGPRPGSGAGACLTRDRGPQ